RVAQVRRVLLPQVQHDAAVPLAGPIPIRRTPVKAIWHFLPHERRVLSLGSLTPLEQRWTRAPHHGRRDRSGLVMTNHVPELIDVIEPDDGHERLRQL